MFIRKKSAFSYLNIFVQQEKKGGHNAWVSALSWLLLTCWVALEQRDQVAILQSLPNIVRALEKVLKPSV